MLMRFNFLPMCYNNKGCQVSWRKAWLERSFMHVYGCDNDILINFLSTAQS